MDLSRTGRSCCRNRWQAAIHCCIGGVILLALASAPIEVATAQQPADAAANPAKVDGEVAGDTSATGAAPVEATPAAREREAWRLLTDAMADTKHPQTQIQALAALGLLGSPRSEKMIADAMADSDLDVRTAAVLSAGQTKDRNLTTNVRNLLDDKEPQVAFTAATTLWKMGDRSGEDILMSVVDGERSANATMMHGTEHKIGKDLHDPAMLAKLGALQGASMMLGPFGFGITAFEYMHQSGGDLARVSAIEQISQERTEPIHQELIAALTDKDQTVRAAAAKALVDSRDKTTSAAVYALLIDPKQPVRLTAAAAYLRTVGTPGPGLDEEMLEPGSTPQHRRKRLTTPSTTKPMVPSH
jgi:HEAT repeat protein